jgi:hypothetical protein
MKRRISLKHLLATGACQAHSEEACYGYLILSLTGVFVLFYTSRVMCKGRLRTEEIIFSLKHDWRFVDCEAFALKALSRVVDEKAV